MKELRKHNRLLWELQTINDVSDSIAQSLDPQSVLSGAMALICRAFGVSSCAIRLKNAETGAFDVAAVEGAPLVVRLWTANGGPVPRPSDAVIEAGHAVLIDDLATIAGSEDIPARSAVSVPMVAHDELIGTLTVTAPDPGWFTAADQRVLTTIAGHIGVAMQNARLHAVVRRGKREWEQTFDAIADPIAVFNAEGVLLRGNAALAAHLGCDLRSLAGRMCREVGFCGGTCPACDVLGHAGQAREAQIAFASGQIFRVTTFPMASEGPGAVVQVAKDVTAEIASARRLQTMSEELAAANQRTLATLSELKRTQSHLVQIEKLSSIGELVAGLAHELNNPLTSVIGYAQLLLDDIQTPRGIANVEGIRQDLARIAEESERAARIVRNLLAFARRQTSSRALHDPRELVARALALREYALRNSGVEIVKVIGEDLPPVVVDPNQIQQALLNLILNAEQAMRDRPVRQLGIGVRYVDEAAALELTISDTGHGIAASHLSRVFDPFFTTREVGQGTGLGLSICFGVMREHGGDISVRSAVGRGTTFTLLLPARRQDLDGRRALVIQSSRDDGAALAATLDAWGYEVTPAASIDTALTQYTAGVFDLILIDSRMLDDHEDAWRDARRADLRVTPVVVTGTDMATFEGAAPDAVVSAPFQLRSLHAAIQAATRECV